MIKGIDIGYDTTKDNQRRLFKSAFSHSEKLFTSSKHIIINGKDYYVGVGNPNSEVDKTDSETNKVCFLSNLAMTNADEYFIVTGLPIGQLKSQGEKLKETILSYNKSDVYYDGRKYNVNIKDVLVYPQGASALYSMEQKLEGGYIIVDPGGFTINIAEIDVRYGDIRIVKYSTLYRGVRTLYSTVIEAINKEFTLKLEPTDAEEILTKGTLCVRGVDVDLRFLQPILLDYMEPIIDEIKLNYRYDTKPMYLCGGGAEILSKPFSKRFYKVTTMDNSQFATAIGYYNIGTLRYHQYL